MKKQIQSNADEKKELENKLKQQKKETQKLQREGGCCSNCEVM